jgi:hypothetical protein
LLYFGQLMSLAYIHDYDSTTRSGDLQLYMLEGRQRFDVDAHVRAFEGVWWPELGLVYSKVESDDRGVWFAALDVPCRQLGGSLLECAF